MSRRLCLSRIILLLLALFFTFSLYQFHVLHHDLFPKITDKRWDVFFLQKPRKRKKKRKKKKKKRPMKNCTPSVACLSCAAYGGPYDADAIEDIVYWRDIPKDAEFHSIFANHQDGPEQYVTFEQDEGGFNNIRMGAETAMLFAVATGRTLVLPPEQSIWAMDQQEHPDDNNKKHKTDFGFHDFFPLDMIQREFPGFKWIRFEDYLTKVVMTGQLKDEQGNPVFPPNNRTNWSDGKKFEEGQWEKRDVLCPWMRSSAKQVTWAPRQCAGVFPAEGGSASHESMVQALAQVLRRDEETYPNANPDERYKKRVESYLGNPTPVNASTVDRLAEMVEGRKELCIYDESFQNALVLHMGGTEQSGFRTLVPFYAFFFFENYHHDLWSKRFARDHLRFLDEIQCAAARIVAQVRHLSQFHNASYDGKFDSMHVRRNDFSSWGMAAEAVMSAEDLYAENTVDMFREGRTVYIATDERDLSFFNPFHVHYQLLFLNDFKKELGDLNPNYYGMVDQLVAARGDTFAGTYLSTFSAYINRIRGYHARKEKVKGYDQGRIDSFYLTRPHWYRDRREIMQTYKSLEKEFWFQEFPIAWRDIDNDVQETDVVQDY